MAFKKRRLASTLSAARKSASGAYLMEWRPAADAPGADHAIECVIQWCRETLGATRRPWGIADFDLAIAVNEGGPRPRSTRFLRLQPGEIYDDGLRKRLAAFLQPPGADVATLSVAVALFSWGDAVYNAV